MAIKQLNPYFNFNGTAEKAIKFYESALGAKVEGLQRFGDIPGNNPAPENKDRIIHALLRIGEKGTVMISDTQPGDDVRPGSNTYVCLDFDDVADCTNRFDALSRDGKVLLPLQDMFWGAKFGMLLDAFGIRWMFNCELKK